MNRMSTYEPVKNQKPDNLDNELIAVYVKTPRFGTIIFQCKRSSCIKDVKEKFFEAVEISSRLRLLYNRQEREDEKKLSEIEPDLQNMFEIVFVGVEFSLEKSKAFKKVNDFRILLRNVKECVESVKNGINPRNRRRFNEPATLSPPQPTTRYFGRMLIELAVTIEKMSKNLAKMAEFLIEDPNINNPVVLEEKRRLIQNNMDSVRYAHYMLKNMSNICIPFTNPRGRLQIME